MPLWAGALSLPDPDPDAGAQAAWPSGTPTGAPRARSAALHRVGWAALAVLLVLVAVWEDGFEERYGRRSRFARSPSVAADAKEAGGSPPPGKALPGGRGTTFDEGILAKIVLPADAELSPAFYLKQASGRKKLDELDELGPAGKRRFGGLGFRAAEKSFFASAAFLQSQAYPPGQISWVRSSAYLFDQAAGAAKALDFHERMIRKRYKGMRPFQARLGNQTYGMGRTDEVTVLVLAWRNGNLLLALEVVGGRAAMKPGRAKALARRIDNRARGVS